MTKNSFDGFTSYSSSSNENWQKEKNSSCSLTRYHDGILHRNKNNCDHKNHFFPETTMMFSESSPLCHHLH